MAAAETKDSIHEIRHGYIGKEVTFSYVSKRDKIPKTYICIVEKFDNERFVLSCKASCLTNIREYAKELSNGFRLECAKEGFETNQWETVTVDFIPPATFYGPGEVRLVFLDQRKDNEMLYGETR